MRNTEDMKRIRNVITVPALKTEMENASSNNRVNLIQYAILFSFHLQPETAFSYDRFCFCCKLDQLE